MYRVRAFGTAGSVRREATVWRDDRRQNGTVIAEAKPPPGEGRRRQGILILNEIAARQR